MFVILFQLPGVYVAQCHGGLSVCLIVAPDYFYPQIIGIIMISRSDVYYMTSVAAKRGCLLVLEVIYPSV